MNLLHFFLQEFRQQLRASESGIATEPAARAAGHSHHCQTRALRPICRQIPADAPRRFDPDVVVLSICLDVLRLCEPYHNAAEGA